MIDAPISTTGRFPAPFDEQRYVPILLTRQGERHALRVTDGDVRNNMTPLFVVHPINRDPTTNVLISDPESHAEKLIGQLAKDWGSGPAFVDLRWVDSSQPTSRGIHLVEQFLRGAFEAGLRLAPAISSDQPTEYRSAAIRTANALGASVCLRLSPEEWSDIGTPLGDGRVLGLLGETGQNAEDVHVIIDFQDQIPRTIAVALAAIRPVLSGFPERNRWASLTVAGTGMPVGTADVGADNSAELPRLEWLLWNALAESGHRRPSFGDYVVQHPNPLSDFNPLFMDSSAQLRYTIARAWFVARGRGVRRVGNEQIRDLAAQVVSHAQYSGPEYSWGDRWLDDCAANRISAGNQGVWRKVATNHHLTFVARQVSNRVG
ncbi:Uncharacterised protein [Mycobacteroides abscessus subsp. bolletii]|uniref:beta family protein n=1 Tax=Mycobacteroides abscessus TaxID=36809 RepID=UPI0009A7F2A1|nr:beta family protein [Mycobacteroides abscessus]SLE92580.1 Uncharacterised protein [Mycobacteroides abscessus subsp. bolletii]